MSANPPDPQRYRVTRLCRCANDYAEGYGATIEEARANCARFWRRDNHRLRDIVEEIVEVAVIHDAQGSSHYELLEPVTA